MNYIELFAGCGGLTLGLEEAGFELSLANEISPMAAETFAYNILNENIEEIAKAGKKTEKSYWLSSRYEDVNSRLRENPYEFPELSEGVNDIPEDLMSIKGKLIVGNIVHLNDFINEHPALTEALQTNFGNGGMDLVSGGPPCQSFSMAGMRQKDSDKNTLPWEFAKFVEKVRPKFVLLENVTGILRAFKQDGKEYYAWFEVAKAFASIGFVPLCLHVNARHVGVPQNRPRFILLAVREDVFSAIEPSLNDSEVELFSASKVFLNAMKIGKSPKFGSLPYFDVSKEDDLKLFKTSFLSSLVGQQEISVGDAIGDLMLKRASPLSSYVRELNSRFVANNKIKNKSRNHEPRQNNFHVQCRFRIYQILRECSVATSKEVVSLLKGNSTEISTEAWEQLQVMEFLVAPDELQTFASKGRLEAYIKAHPTKKQTQKALIKGRPAPAALSIPDDGCHYKEIRTLTVREMARIQSFPDNFVFRSKITTGGKMRRYEVPQYTQVGNAVPPLLGFALGKVIKRLNQKSKAS